MFGWLHLLGGVGMKYGLMFSAFGGGGMAQSTFAALKQSVGAVAKYLFLTADFLN